MEAKKELGDNFNVLTIGFDAEHDTPDRLKEYGENFKDAFKHVRFAAGNEETIMKLAKEFGFYFEKADHGFEHIDMVSVVNADGSIYKQVYSSKIKTEDVRKPLHEIITGHIPAEAPPSVFERLKMFCSSFDPVSGRYYINYPLSINILLQLVIIFSIGYFIVAPRIKTSLITSLNTKKTEKIDDGKHSLSEHPSH